MHLRPLVVVSTAVALVVGVAGTGAGPALAAARHRVTTVQPSPAGEAAAYTFLDDMMDRYASGTTLRLVQSFTGGVLEKRGFTDSVTYDDALVIDALLARGTADDVARSEVIGNALLYVQAEDPDHDGRIRAAYAPTPLTAPADVVATDPTSDVGNMAWVGQALVQLYARTGDTSYLTGATAIGQWIERNTYDTRGAGGFTGGVSASGATIRWKSTEHNIDLYAFFTLLAAETGDTSWTTLAGWARGFVAAMWQPASGSFAVGTLDDGVTVNAAEQPEDVNSWSYLALRDPAYAASVDWDVTHLSVSKHGFSGVSFCAGDRSGVWFEGTSHLADALELRGAPGDASLAADYLADVATAQAYGPHADGLGIVAASKNGLRDCDGDRYDASLHTGATSWYLLALQSADPFSLIP
jgi:hypothetical protein